MNQRFVSIIIPTYRDWRRLALCLEALERQTYPQDRFEVLVVNNDPEDRLPEAFKIKGNCMLLTESRPGSYAARNAGLKLCKGEIIGFTDSDCIPDQYWIENAVRFFNEYPEFKRMGGGIEIFSKKKNPSSVEWYDHIFAFPQEAYVRSGNAVTANMFTLKEVFDQIGGFNDQLMSGGDYQWGKLANQKGYKIGYAPNSFVKHPARSSVRELVKKARRVGEGQAMFKKDQPKCFYKRLAAYIRILKPRFWEIKIIFQNNERMNFFDKLYVVLLRHYVTAAGDYSRLIHEKKP